MSALSANPSRGLRGTITVPGDKSISHRSLILGALAVGETRIDGLLEGEDVLGTAGALRAYGADIVRAEDGSWRVHGVGVGALLQPDDILDLGNSGTAVRLLLGLAASHPVRSVFTGDASLRRRPMQRVITPLSEMGARFDTAEGGRLPLSVTGADVTMPIAYRTPVASAQVKSAVLLAGLNAPGETSVIEAQATRDHTERMLRQFGAELETSVEADGAHRVRLVGQPELKAGHVVVPGDPSSAAFAVVAALIVPDSKLTVAGVLRNPLRFALFDTLMEMGASIGLENEREAGGETLVDLVVETSTLHGIEVPAERAPSMIDEYPILAVAAAYASGTTRMHGLAELRVKESDRLAVTAAGLRQLGVDVEELADGLVVTGGRPPRQPDGERIATEMDHRIAMAFLVCGLAAAGPVTIDDAEMIATSFPGFADLMRGLGADLTETERAA